MLKYISLVVFLLTIPNQLLANPWKPTSASVTFRIKHALGSTADGSFKGFTGTLVFDSNDLPNASLKGSIETKTISTGISLRDNGLRGDGYFDAEKYPKIMMVSTKIERGKQASEYVGYFNLTIKNVTQSIRIPFTFIQNGSQASFKGSFTINRIDYGIGGKSALLGDNATITIDIQTQQQ